MHIDVLCLGNPKLIGDSIGPIVGSLLYKESLGINIIGTLDDPVIRSNYNEKVKLLRSDAVHIVVDSAIGPNIGEIKLLQSPMQPGGALTTWQDKPVGHYSILATTCSSVEGLIHMRDCCAAALSTEVFRMLMDAVKERQKKITYI